MRAPRYSTETWKNFVALEGLDGSGTSTQSIALERALQRAGKIVVRGEEPTTGPVGELVRQVLGGHWRPAPDERGIDRQLAFLFAADRNHHLFDPVQGIRRALDAGAVALTTRYFFSSYAYNARTAEDFDLVERLNQAFPLPQVVVFLRVPIEVTLSRLAGRPALELYEKEGELRRVAANYEAIFAPIRDRVLEFDATRPKEVVGAAIAAAVLERLG